MSTIPDADLLDNSCSQVSLFPSNILHHTTPQYHLNSYKKLLADREPFMFCEDGLAALDMLEYDDNVKGENKVLRQKLMSLTRTQNSNTLAPPTYLS
jgi:hypothetical protein